MTLEDAKYYSILLGVGEFDEFESFMKNVINGNEEIDDIVAELLYESDNYSKCCDILSSYISGKVINDVEVAYKLICYVRSKQNVHKIDRNHAIELFVKFSREANKYHEDIIEEPWVTMKLLGMLLDEKNEIIYESDFENFINNGVILTENKDIQERLSNLFG